MQNFTFLIIIFWFFSKITFHCCILSTHISHISRLLMIICINLGFSYPIFRRLAKPNKWKFTHWLTIKSNKPAGDLYIFCLFFIKCFPVYYRTFKPYKTLTFIKLCFSWISVNKRGCILWLFNYKQEFLFVIRIGSHNI
jgi:hypothetical protein